MASIYEKAGTILQNVTEVNNARDTLEETLNPCQLGLELYDGEDVYNPRVVFRGYSEEGSAPDGYWRMARLDELWELEARLDGLGDLDDRYALKNHSHSISNISLLQSALDAKQNLLTLPLSIGNGGTGRDNRAGAAYNVMSSLQSINDINYVCALYGGAQTGGCVPLDSFRQKIFDRGFGGSPGDLNDAVYATNPIIGSVNVTANGPNSFTGWAYLMNIPHRGGYDDGNTHRLQILITPLESAATNPTMYMRKLRTSGGTPTWTGWVEVGGGSSGNQYVLKSGDTMTGKLVVQYNGPGGWPIATTITNDSISLSGYVGFGPRSKSVRFDESDTTIYGSNGIVRIRGESDYFSDYGGLHLSGHFFNASQNAEHYSRFGYIEFSGRDGHSYYLSRTIASWENLLHISAGFNFGFQTSTKTYVHSSGVRIYDNGDISARGDYLTDSGTIMFTNKQFNSSGLVINGDDDFPRNGAVRIKFTANAAYLERYTNVAGGWQQINWNTQY